MRTLPIAADITLPIVRQLFSGSSAADPEGQKLMTKVPKSIGKDKPLLVIKA